MLCSLLRLTLTAARAKLRRRAKRPPQFGVGLADLLGILSHSLIQEKGSDPFSFLLFHLRWRSMRSGLANCWVHFVSAHPTHLADQYLLQQPPLLAYPHPNGYYDRQRLQVQG
jgi:hypothetical protein